MLLLQSVAFSDSHTHLHLQAPLLLCSKHCSRLSLKRIQMFFSQDSAFIFRFFCPLQLTLDVLCFCIQPLVLITDIAFWGEDRDGDWKIFVFQKTSFIFILLIPLGPHRQVYAVSTFSIQLCPYQPRALRLHVVCAGICWPLGTE